MKIFQSLFQRMPKEFVGVAKDHSSCSDSRRNFLRRSAVAALSLPLVPSLLYSQEKADRTGYRLLSDENESKFLKYTVMIQKLWSRDLNLSQKLHPDFMIDLSPEQQAVFSQQKPCEFTKGYVYHGSGDLTQTLLKGSLAKNSHVTRVPQTWALQPFVDLEKDPAIFVIDALDFNRAVKTKRADLRLDIENMDEVSIEAGRTVYSSELYPSFTEEFPISSVLQIITNQATYEKYDALVKKLKEEPDKLSHQEKQLASILQPLLEQDKIQIFGSEISADISRLSPEQRFLELTESFQKHMSLYGLKEQIPKFRLSTKTSTGENDKSDKPLIAKQVLSKMISEIDGVINRLSEKEKKNQATKAEQERKKKFEFLRNTILGIGGTALAGGSAYWAIKELRKALELQSKESQNEQNLTTRAKRKKRK